MLAKLIQAWKEAWREAIEYYPPSKGGRGTKPTTPRPPPPKGQAGTSKRK